MSAPQQNIHQPTPLLPKDKNGDRPLFMVMAVLAFLATLTLLAVKTSYQMSARWGADLENTMTVQIKPGANIDAAQSAEAARTILRQFSSVERVEILPEASSRALLEPWLGTADLPADLPLPILLDVTLKPEQTIDKQKLGAAFTQAGLRADIDDHGRWRKQLKRSTSTARTLALLALFLVIIAVISAVIFAVRAGVVRQRRVIDVLHQVGADMNYTARLFSLRFAVSGLKAGAAGAFGALLVLWILTLVSSIGGGLLLPLLSVSLSDLYFALAIPVLMALLSGLSAWRTIRATLLDELYP